MSAPGSFSTDSIGAGSPVTRDCARSYGRAAPPRPSCTACAAVRAFRACRVTPLAAEVVTRCWDELYVAGRYQSAPPLRFVRAILDLLQDNPDIRSGRGLYVGCGNGRNFRPLLRASLDIYGLDISHVALDRLMTAEPDAAGRLLHGDFRTVPIAGPFAYLIAIQVFQHGTEADVAAYFSRAASVLRPGGLFFVRVNSTASDIFFPYRRADENAQGGFSVECTEGPKAGQGVHFYTAAELRARTAENFTVVVTPKEVHEERVAPRRGSWAQWEAVFRYTPGGQV